MKKRLNVLSIDWDYFIKADMKQRIRLFPDNGNEKLPFSVRDVVWISRYSEVPLEKIKLDKPSCNMLSDVFQAGCKKAMIVDSHRYAYKFIDDYMDTDYSGINLINVDFHHDCYIGGEEVDAGNWLRSLIKKYRRMDNSFTWVARQDSGMDALKEHPLPIEISYDINIISKYDWDLIFFCKSEMWSPPHLDIKFRELALTLKDISPSVLYEEDVDRNRYSEEFKQQMEMLRQQIEEFNKQRAAY